MAGTGSLAPVAGVAGKAAMPWLLGGGAAVGLLSGIFGEEETQQEKLSNLLMGENIKTAKFNNAEAQREAAMRRKQEAKQKKIGAGLGNLMRGANLARKMMA
jgi:hypothetical protein